MSPRKRLLPLQWLKKRLLKQLSLLTSLKLPKMQPSLQKLLTLQKTPLKLPQTLPQTQPPLRLMPWPKLQTKLLKKLKPLPSKLRNSF